MPIPQTLARYTVPLSPPTTTNTTTPARPKHIHSMVSTSTNTSSSPTIISNGQQQKLNVVTRVAIEGKAKQGQDGAAIKMYLKISLPLESTSPGMTIPLFPEENVKILTSQVHPLDNHSAPYNFSSTLSPLLHHAARALNLPARSSETFDSAFNISPVSNSSTSSSRVTKPSNSTGSENIAPIDAQYTGHILVSGYNISYVLPKVFPGLSREEVDSEGLSRTAYKSRRLSIGERNTAQFMAAIDMWIPYVSRPPRSPYLLSIPIPRCLHNNIKLRIFPPKTVSASFASLSSVDDDGIAWDLTSDPHVTRITSTRPRSNSSTHFADDESSDSSITGFSDGCGIHGTFPSAERIRVRWAKPLKNIEVSGGGGDGRRRVGVKEVKGEMTCIIRGKLKAKDGNGVEGLLMDVEYKGTCRGVWFPGVATLLGMDVSLEAKGSDVHWTDGSPSEWEVNGGVGYTGFDTGAFPKQLKSDSRTSSVDSTTHHTSYLPSPQDGRSTETSRANSLSTSSLLRAPLPAQNVAEYSFEGSNTTIASSTSSPLGTMSSMSSLMPTSVANSVNTQRSPSFPITLHININEIVPPAKNIFTFTVSGRVLVVARTASSRPNPYALNSEGETDTSSDPEPIVLPRFTVLAADSESTVTIVRNEVDTVPTIVEVYNATGDIYRDPQTKKTVLQKGGFTKCNEEGGRILLRSINSMNRNGRSSQPPSRSRTPNGNVVSQVASNSSLGRLLIPPRPKRDGPLMIPSVMMTVTPLMHENDALPSGYAIRTCLNAPADTNSEWLEFGLAQPRLSFLAPVPGKDTRILPRVVITSATVEGIPIKFDISTTAKHEASSLDVPFEEVGEREWVSWVKMHVGATGGGAVVIDYTVEDPERKRKTKGKDLLNVFLPTFSVPVGRSEVNIDELSGVDISLLSNFAHQQSTNSGPRLLHFSMEEYFCPQLSLTIRPTLKRNWTGLRLLIFITWTLILIGLIFMYRLGDEVRQMKRALEDNPVVVGSRWNDILDPITITTTVYSDTGARWKAGKIPVETDPLTEPPTGQPTPTPIIAATTSSLTNMKKTEQIFTPTSMATGAVPSTSVTPAETNALLPIQYMLSAYWPVQDFRATLDKILQTVDMVWQIFRKVYHYPLDPT